MMRILFLFSGAANRAHVLEEVMRGENADTALRGANHLPGADFLDVEAAVRAMLPHWAYWFLPWQMRSVLLLPRILAYDVVLSQDDLPLGYIVSQFSRLRRRKTKWISIAINTSILLRRHKHHVVRLRLLKAFWKSFAKIACLSRQQLEDLANAGVPRAKLVFVPFGVDADFYGIVAAEPGEDLILSVGRDLGRDYLTLLAAARRSDCPFVIVAAHKNLPADTLLPSNVTVQYNLPAKEVRSLYARACVVVVPSKRADVPDGSDCSGQTVILDAMAAGRPVIATERPWIADYFTQGEDLFIVSAGDDAALAAAIELLRQDTAMRKRLACSGHAKVQRQYTTRVLAQALYALAREG